MAEIDPPTTGEELAIAGLEPVARPERSPVAWRRSDPDVVVAWKPPSAARLDARPANDAEGQAGSPSFGRREIAPGDIRKLDIDPTTASDRRWIGWVIAGAGALIAALLGMMAGGVLAL